MNPFTWWRLRPYQRHLVALCNRHRARVGRRPLIRI